MFFTADSGDREAQLLVSTLEDQDLFLDSAGLGQFARTGGLDEGGEGAASLHGSNPDFLDVAADSGAERVQVRSSYIYD